MLKKLQMNQFQIVYISVMIDYRKNGLTYSNITSIIYYKLIINKVMLGTKLIWEYIKSCFGSGKWVEDNKFIETDKWKEI